MNSNLKDFYKNFYEDIYEILQKHKDDTLFLKVIPQTKEMINALEEGEDLFEKKFFRIFSEEWYSFNFSVNSFEQNNEDFRWYYENKDNYIKEKLRYEYLDNDGEYKTYYNIGYEDVYYTYSTLDEILFIYNECIFGGYGKAIYHLCHEDMFYILTYDTCEDKELPIKYALTYLTEYINSNYDTYKNDAIKNRNIFKEIDEHIAMLSNYAKDDVFIKEVPNIFEIIENLKSAKGKDEYEAYKIFWQLSNIRESINLYKKNRDDMKFFHNNRDISKFIPTSIEYINDRDITGLYTTIQIFESNLTLASCRRRFILRNEISKDESIEIFIKGVINKINKYFDKYMKPNLFDYAVGELTNDAIICWIIAWANSNNEGYKNLADDFIRLFIEKDDFIVKYVNIKRQYKNIDILVEVNDSEVIVIEDKVNTSHHSNQLEKYKEIIENSEEYKDYNYHFIYFKVGNECEYNGVEQAGYKRITRENILNIITKYKGLENYLINDYIDYLYNKELSFNNYKYEDDIYQWEWGTWEGYYNNLQKQKDIKEFCWNYVSNKSGGFLGFFWSWNNLKYIKDNEEIDYKLYLQIEANPNNDKIVRIAFKLNCENHNYRKDIRYHVYNHLKNLQINDIQKTKFKNGLYMTIAEIKFIQTREKLDEMICLAEDTLKTLVTELIETT